MLPAELFKLLGQGVPTVKRPDGLRADCSPCEVSINKRQNAKRAKKRKQQSFKLTETQVEWIKSQKNLLSTRATAKAFGEKYHDIKIHYSTVSRIFTGKLHTNQGKEGTDSIYDMLESAGEFDGTIEEFLESLDPQK